MKQFEDLYSEIEENEEIKLAWEEARAEQKKINKISITISIVITTSLIILMLILLKDFSKFNSIFIAPCIFGIFFINMIILIINSFARKKQRKYNTIFKETIIKKLIENFYKSVEYYPQKQLPKRIYDEGKYEYYNRYYSDDYIEAKINNKYDIGMGEVKTVHETTRRDSNGRTHTTRTTMFHGIFAKIVIDKSINSELRIKRNGSGLFGKNKLEMDSSEFEKYFDVSATNKIIGMQLLTADIMEELINFINKTNMKYDIVIKNNNIYLRFHCGTMFEPQALKKGIIDKEHIQKYFYMLNFTYNLSDKIIKTIYETEI